MKYYGKAESVATRIIEHFQTGNIPKALAPIFIRRTDNIPCRAWSWSNQLITAICGYDDARTYRDWQAAGRQVRKGEKSFHILEPCKKRITDRNTETGEDQARMILYGFKAAAPFEHEQTHFVDETTPPQHSDRDLSADRFREPLPLDDVALAWGFAVQSYNGRAGSFLGKYRRGESIAIGVENLSTWTHELIHAADDRLGALTERGQHWRSETVAELGGAVLLSCIGQDHDADLGGCWDYIQHYADANGKPPIDAAMIVLNRLCRAVALVLETAEGQESVATPESGVAA